MRIGLITDTHFGHENVIEYDGRKPDFEERILRGIRNFKPEILIHLGDICFGRQEEHHQRLFDAAGDAKRWLVRGNHDKNSMTWYMQHGWDCVVEELHMERLGYRLVLTHRPYAEYLPPEWLNIHGHIHKSVWKPEIGLHMPDNNYQPYSLDSLVQRYRKEVKS